ncbi:MAG TPA: hypothetical protein VGZ02_17525 [Candidatus Baltobacteraceae bacterium]|jgi:hypothetical protein|nr:hypothetical protein [Candidatus Baltobacteraceae bacterium]
MLSYGGNSKFAARKRKRLNQEQLQCFCVGLGKLAVSNAAAFLEVQQVGPRQHIRARRSDARAHFREVLERLAFMSAGHPATALIDGSRELHDPKAFLSNAARHCFGEIRRTAQPEFSCKKRSAIY